MWSIQKILHSPPTFSPRHEVMKDKFSSPVLIRQVNFLIFDLSSPANHFYEIKHSRKLSKIDDSFQIIYFQLIIHPDIRVFTWREEQVLSALVYAQIIEWVHSRFRIRFGDGAVRLCENKTFKKKNINFSVAWRRKKEGGGVTQSGHRCQVTTLSFAGSEPGKP